MIVQCGSKLKPHAPMHACFSYYSVSDLAFKVGGGTPPMHTCIGGVPPYSVMRCTIVPSGNVHIPRVQVWSGHTTLTPHSGSASSQINYYRVLIVAL